MAQAAKALLKQIPGGDHRLNLRLRWAAQKGDLAEAEMLLREGAIADAEFSAALWDAARNGHRDIVNLLLEAGANPHDREGDALRWAQLSGFDEIANDLEHAMRDIQSSCPPFSPNTQ